MLVSLIVIFGILAGLALLLRKLRNGGWTRPGAPAARIRIVATRPIGWQSSLMIVEADGQRFLVGSGRAGLTTIGALRDSDFGGVMDAAGQPRPLP